MSNSETAAKRNIRHAIEAVAARLGNTATICRKCYVHPEVVACYLEGSLVETLATKIKTELKNDLADLPPEEAATLTLLHTRLTARDRVSNGRELAMSGTAAPSAR